MKCKECGRHEEDRHAPTCGLNGTFVRAAHCAEARVNKPEREDE